VSWARGLGGNLALILAGQAVANLQGLIALPIVIRGAGAATARLFLAQYRHAREPPLFIGATPALICANGLPPPWMGLMTDR